MIGQWVENVMRNGGTIAEAGRSGNTQVISSMLGPALRGLVLQVAKRSAHTEVQAGHSTSFDWTYVREKQSLAKLYSAGKSSQWDAEKALDWKSDVDPHRPEQALFLDDMVPLRDVPAYRRLSIREKEQQKCAMLAWMLSQFLHGEQGALFAACQVTESVANMDAKLFGSTQVIDEGRHVEVFHRYLTEKLGKLYQINDNLYVVIDALMSDSRWDIKFLGMQILIEGLALGAFATLRSSTHEPLLRETLKLVITDEARHVHFGVVALSDYYREGLDEKERREREDWTYQMVRLMRNRFLAHEFYDEYYGHAMTRAEWDRTMLESEYMKSFRKTMFRRVIPNLKRIGLLTERLRPHYESLGILSYEHGPAAPELSANDLINAE
jgi:hypothetical protein